MLVDVDLLAVEITALTDKDPSEHFSELTAEFGTPYDARIDAPATPGQKAKPQELPTEDVKETELVGEPIIGPHWRPERGHRCWVVCCPNIRHGEPLQDLCGEL